MTLAGGLTLSMFTLAWYAIAVSACLTLSLFSYYAVEMPVVGLRRRILSAHQTLKVRPQPGLARRLLQKIRRARCVCSWGLLSSNPDK